MDLSKLCAYCFSNKLPGAVCPHCHWQEGLSTASPSYLPPQTILHGKYLLGRVLGQGGFGITYLALDLDLGIKLAIKEYFPREFANRNSGEFSVSIFSGDARSYFQEGLDKFLEEAKTLARLEGHPNIVSVRDFFRENGTAYFVMNYLDGSTLKEYLAKRSAPLDFNSAMQIILPLMDALKEIHSHGILHRDISPDNIFITDKGVVKILDFGAARQVMSGHSKSLSIILKPGYAPEEQYRSKGNQGPWTDIYALSATVYKMLTGKTPPESLDRINGELLVPPSQLGVQLPEQYEAALLKGLAVKAENRYQNIQEYRAALTSASTIPIISPEIQTPEPAVRQPPPASLSIAPVPKAQIYNPPDPSKNNSLIIGLASLLCLMVIAVGIYFYLEEDSPKSTPSVSISSKNNQPSPSAPGQSPEKVVRDFYDNMSAKNYPAISSLLGGEMLAHYSSEAFSLDDLSITSYRIIENQPLSTNQARVSVEANFVDSLHNSYKVTDVFLLENQNGRWLIVQLMDEKY